jgi:hypothetical protein
VNVGTEATKRGELAHIATLEQLVKFYVANRERLWAGVERSRDRHDPIIDFCREAKDLVEAIERATAGRRRSGKMFSEDSCIKATAREEFLRRLLKRRAEIARVGEFDALYDLVRSEKIVRVGDLMVYNVAARIGGFLGLDPTFHVYVHAGPRKGWRALVGRPDSRYRIPLEEVPSELRVLPPCLIEDFLCEFSEFVHPGLWNGAKS